MSNVLHINIKSNYKSLTRAALNQNKAEIKKDAKVIKEKSKTYLSV